MVAVWLIAGDRFEGAVSFFMRKPWKNSIPSIRTVDMFFISGLKYEQMFMGLSMKFGELQLKSCHYEKYIHFFSWLVEFLHGFCIKKGDRFFKTISGN